MTRKHFEAIAAILAFNISNPITRQTVSEELASYFATVNPNFDRSRFLKACGF